MPTVDVVIPTWNKADLVLGCLASLQGQATHSVIVVDNGSADATAAQIAAAFPEVRVLALPDNIGFARAVNAGIAEGEGEVVVVLNNDVVAEPGFIAAIVKPLADFDIDSVSGVLLTADGKAVDAAGVVADAGLAGYSHLRGRPLAALTDPPQPLGPCGGAAAYRRSALVAVGAFDEEIFAYSEDLELALRLRAAGHRSVLAPGARVVHLGSATLGVGSPMQLRLSGWARGYVLGRYRVGLQWVLIEFGVGLIVAARTRSTTPVASRLAGLCRGRQLPRRQVETTIATVGLFEGMRRRRAAVSSD